MRVKITGTAVITKDLDFRCFCSMVREGTCAICGNEGEVHRHHIISRAKAGRLKPGEHGYDLDLVNRTENIIVLCVPCHQATDSHIYWKMHDILDDYYYSQAQKEARWGQGKSFQCEGTTRKGERCQINVSKKGRRCAAHRKQKGRPDTFRCAGINQDGSRCRHKKTRGYPNGYCPSHQSQASPDESETWPQPHEPPGLHEEGHLEEEEMFALEDWRAHGIPFDKTMFSNKSPAWQRMWLTRKKRQ